MSKKDKEIYKLQKQLIKTQKKIIKQLSQDLENSVELLEMYRNGDFLAPDEDEETMCLNVEAPKTYH